MGYWHNTGENVMINFKGRIEGGLILEVQMDEKKEPEERVYLGVRCGLSWPLAINPGGYYVLVAQEGKKLMTGEHPLLIIREFKALSLSSLFKKMFNDMGIFGCFEIFTDLSARYDNYKLALSLFMKTDRNLQEVRVKPAPYAEGYDGFIHGHNNITKWIREIKGLTIPKDFAIHSQLREIRELDLKKEPQERFFAMNALRYVLGAFETSAIPQSTKNRVVEKGIPPGAWT